MNRHRREAAVASEEARQLARNLEELRVKLAAAEAREREIVKRAKDALSRQQQEEAARKRSEMELAARRRDREQALAAAAANIRSTLTEYLLLMEADAPAFLDRLEKEQGTIRSAERAKLENPQVRELLAERAEWLAVKGTTTVTAVRREAEEKAKKLSDQLESLVPGIMSAGKGTIWLEPLYQIQSDRTTTMLLPVSEPGWAEFQAGADTPRAVWAARVVFSLARHFHDPAFAIRDGLVVATVAANRQAQVSDTVPLVGEEMSFLLSVLPEKVQEVFA